MADKPRSIVIPEKQNTPKPIVLNIRMLEDYLPAADLQRPKPLVIPDKGRNFPLVVSSHDVREPQRSRTLDLVDAVKKLEPSFTTVRVKGRIDAILSMKIADILNWGERNLVPVQEISIKHGKLSNEITQLDVAKALRDARAAYRGVSGLLNALLNKGPDFYAKLLRGKRNTLQNSVLALEALKETLTKENQDLYCDALTLLICVEEFEKDLLKTSAQSRAETLLKAYHVGVGLDRTLDKNLQDVTQSISEIDNFLLVDIPNWKLESK